MGKVIYFDFQTKKRLIPKFEFVKTTVEISNNMVQLCSMATDNRLDELCKSYDEVNCMARLPEIKEICSFCLFQLNQLTDSPSTFLNHQNILDCIQEISFQIRKIKLDIYGEE